MNEKRTPVALDESDRTFLQKLLLASQVILEAAPDIALVSDPLEVELGIFKDRVQFMLLLPDAVAQILPWRDGPKNGGYATTGNGDPAA